MIPASEQQRTEYRKTGHWGDTTLAEMFRANVLKHPDREAVVDPSNRSAFCFGDPQRLSYQALSSEVDRIAAALSEQGVVKDDIVFVQLPNVVELLAMYFACAEVGAIISPIPVVYREHELASLLQSAKPKAYVFTHFEGGADYLGMAQKVFSEDTILMAFGEFDEPKLFNLSTHRAAQPALRADVNADDVFTLCWTSGTTGVPKGVPRSHNHWSAIAPITRYAANIQDGDVLLNPFPMVNMGAIGGVIMSWLQSAGTVVLHQPFDLGVFMQQIAQEQPQFTLAPPAILNMLLADPKLAQHFENTSLRSIASGSAPLAPSMIKGFADRFGIDIVNMFGSNEGMSVACSARHVEDPELRASFFPAESHYPTLFDPQNGVEQGSHIALRIVDVETRQVIESDGQSGEVEIKGPTVFEGYYFDDQASAKASKLDAFTADGYFKTGDLFEYAHQQTQLKFVGRCKDLIIRGGVNIAPEELDQLLSGHPDIAEVCSFGVPDQVLGERIGVAILLRENADLEKSGLATFLSDLGVAKQKWPEHVVYPAGPLPRNAMNKVLRHEVRETALKQLNSTKTEASDG